MNDLSPKQRAYNLIRDDGYKSAANKIFGRGIIILIIINVAMVVVDFLEVLPSSFDTAFYFAELISVAVFTFE